MRLVAVIGTAIACSWAVDAAGWWPGLGIYLLSGLSATLFMEARARG